MAAVTPGRTRVPLIAGNWKLNLDHLQAIALVQKLDWTLKDGKHDYADAEVAIFPPFTDLRSVQTIVAADKLKLAYGAQDLSQHDSGAYTGEISGAFLAKLDCRYVLVGHSERRTLHNETDEVVQAKTAAAVRHDLVPVICIGETAEDLEEHGPSAVPVAQLKAAIDGLAPDADIVVAYEPVWAIGTGEVATPDDAQEVCSAIRARVAETAGEEAAAGIRILYGGSVKANNVGGIMQQPDVDGCLVGGASLQADEFGGICRFYDMPLL